MADEIHGQKMSDYTDIDQASELTSTEKAYYKANARVTTFGKVDNGVSTPNSNYNIPLSEISGDSLPTIESGDAGKVLTVAQGGSLEWNDVVIPTYTAADPLSEVGYNQFGLNYNKDQFELGGTNNNELTLTNPVPAPGTNNRGKVLTVDDSDEIVWNNIPAIPEISQYNGDVSVVKATNDTSSGGYVFDVNLDSDTLEKRSTEGVQQVSYIAVKNPVPPTTNANDGDVLTVDANGDYDWAPVSGGGGGNVFSGITDWTNGQNEKVKESNYYPFTDPQPIQVAFKEDSGVHKYRLCVYAGSAGTFTGPWAS